LGNPHAIEPLINILQNVYSHTADRAAVALGQIGNRQVVPTLIAILQSDTQDVATLAGVVEALGELRDARAVEPLIELFQEGDPIGGPGSFICLWPNSACDQLAPQVNSRVFTTVGVVMGELKKLVSIR
jgi:hypothetical protein